MSIPDRECLSAILRELNLQALPRGGQDALMRGVGFEQDVAFAKSLFTDRVAALYRELDGQFQRMVAREEVVSMEPEGRMLLLAVFRRFHEEKLKARAGMDPLGLKLPATNNIEEVIAFQKKMYELFRHLIPQQTVTVASSAPAALFYPPSPKFSPFAIYPPQRNRSPFAIYPPQRNRSMMEADFPPLPFLPFDPRLSADSLRRSESHMERHSFFRGNSFTQLEKGNSVWQEERPLRGFTTFGDEEDTFKPNKRVKRENNVNFAPQNVETVRRELESLAQSRNPSKNLQIDRTMSLQEQSNPPPTSIKSQLRRGTADFQQGLRQGEEQGGAQ